MNRLLQLSKKTKFKSNSNTNLKNRRSPLFSSNTNCSSPISLLAPQHYEPGYAYPLVVWLHGPGGNEREVQKVMPLISSRNHVGVAPRGTDEELTSGGYCWDQNERSIDRCENSVLDSIQVATERYNIRTDRIFLAGYDCGGTMALRIGLRNPMRFAGVISLGGPFPVGMNPLTNIDSIRHLPLLIGLGREAEKYTADRLCQELRLFHIAALKVDLRLYPAGDELTTKMLSDADEWIMRQVAGSPSCISSDLPASSGE